MSSFRGHRIFFPFRRPSVLWFNSMFVDFPAILLWGLSRIYLCHSGWKSSSDRCNSVFKLRDCCTVHKLWRFYILKFGAKFSTAISWDLLLKSELLFLRCMTVEKILKIDPSFFLCLSLFVIWKDTTWGVSQYIETWYMIRNQRVTWDALTKRHVWLCIFDVFSGCVTRRSCFGSSSQSAWRLFLQKNALNNGRQRDYRRRRDSGGGVSTIGSIGVQLDTQAAVRDCEVAQWLH